jgi:hypothetical protein
MKTLKQALEEAGFGLKDLEKMQAQLDAKKAPKPSEPTPELKEDYTDMAQMNRDAEAES